LRARKACEQGRLRAVKGIGEKTERRILGRIRPLESPRTILQDLVEHHGEEEETEMFPRARKLLGREELMRLDEELAQAKASLTESVLTKLVELVRP
jgi:hypothetical protein